MAGKVHSLLINFLFITAQRAVFIIDFFFYVDRFKLLAIKRMKKQNSGLLSLLWHHHRIAAFFYHGFLAPFGMTLSVEAG